MKLIKPVAALSIKYHVEEQNNDKNKNSKKIFV